jgi:hypothetical protein
MVGIGNTQLTVNLTTRDASLNRLNQTATGMSSASAGFVWNPTSKFVIRKEETDRQNDDNLTFLFEYRALLNSRLQTLITQLSNALASDLEIAMSATNAVWQNDRSAMNGLSTNTLQDAGAARTAYNFMTGWMPAATATSAAIDPASATTRTAPDTPYDQTFSATFGANSNISGPARAIRVAGTAGLCQAITGKIDILDIRNLDGITGTPTYQFANQNADGHGRDNVLDNSFAGPLGVNARLQDAKNLFQKVLFDALSSVEYRPVLNSGIFKNVIVSASASLASGSQAQASISMTYNGTRGGGPLDISLDKLTCFYHS